METKTAKRIKGAIVVDVEKCKGCELCAQACPNDVIAFSKELNIKGFHYAYMENPDECTGCENCALVCPDAVITIYKEKKDK